MDSPTDSANWPLGLIGAVLGGAVGYLVFGWLTTNGVYAAMLPPAMVGLGCGMMSKGYSKGLAVVCAVLGFALSLFVEWRFIYDVSMSYFLTHLHQLGTVTWIMILVGAAMAYWFGIGRERFTPEHDDSYTT